MYNEVSGCLHVKCDSFFKIPMHDLWCLVIVLLASVLSQKLGIHTNRGWDHCPFCPCPDKKQKFLMDTDKTDKTGRKEDKNYIKRKTDNQMTHYKFFKCILMGWTHNHQFIFCLFWQIFCPLCPNIFPFRPILCPCPKCTSKFEKWWFFPSMFFCGEATKKSKYRWFKVEGFGDG